MESNGLALACLTLAAFEGIVLVVLICWIALREAYIRSLIREQLSLSNDMTGVLSQVASTIEQSGSISRDTKIEILDALDKVETRITRMIERCHHFTPTPPIQVTTFGADVGGAQFGDHNSSRHLDGPQ